MAVAARKQTNHETGGPTGRLSRRKSSVFADEIAFHEDRQAENSGGRDEVRNLGLSLLQFVGSSLEGGPRGIHPPTYIAALAALAGYGAKFAVSMKISHGALPDDFRRIPLSRSSSIVVSEQVNELVLSMKQPSVASIMTGFALRCGLSQLPDMNALLHGHLANREFAGEANGEHMPDVPSETLLMMYWESVARFFRAPAGDFDLAPLAAAHAAGEAITAYRKSMPVDVALQIALRTAIAMSKVDRAF